MKEYIKFAYLILFYIIFHYCSSKNACGHSLTKDRNKSITLDFINKIIIIKFFQKTTMNLKNRNIDMIYLNLNTCLNNDILNLIKHFTYLNKTLKFTIKTFKNKYSYLLKKFNNNIKKNFVLRKHYLSINESPLNDIENSNKNINKLLLHSSFHSKIISPKINIYSIIFCIILIIVFFLILIMKSEIIQVIINFGKYDKNNKFGYELLYSPFLRNKLCEDDINILYNFISMDKNKYYSKINQYNELIRNIDFKSFTLKSLKIKKRIKIDIIYSMLLALIIFIFFIIYSTQLQFSIKANLNINNYQKIESIFNFINIVYQFLLIVLIFLFIIDILESYQSYLLVSSQNLSNLNNKEFENSI